MTPKYAFVDKMDVVDDTWHIQIKDGDYSGVVYKYGSVKIHENDGKEAVLKFQFAIVEAPDHLHLDDLNHDTDFMNTLGDILHNILTDAFESGKYRLGKKKDDDSEDDSQSVIH